jgi:hypothetical protein
MFNLTYQESQNDYINTDKWIELQNLNQFRAM